MKKHLLGLLLVVVYGCISAQINPEKITIARDSFGVPHIYGPTDAEAAYGLAWAHAEDDFRNIQLNMLPARGMLGEVIGKEGVLFDFAMQFFGIDTMVDNNFDRRLSPEFKKVLAGYVSGVNRYAQLHPDEVLLPKALPFTEKDIVKSTALSLTLFAGAGMALKSIKDNQIHLLHQPNEIGSNSMAIAPSKTDDGKAWLLVNSHQPIEGRFAWYEAHIKSDEGWDVIGGLFPGGTTIFVGTNKNLGWAHTTNYHTFGDIYKLEHTRKKYKYDGEWKNFGVKKARLKIKMGGLKIPITKKIRYCEYGPVFQTKHGWYALRYPGPSEMRSTEQWYKMNKARNFTEFESALKMEALPLFNIMYADVDGTIFYESGLQMPLRDTTLNWNQPITANTSAYKWTKLVPYSLKPRLLNPSCGYLYSCNQTQFAVSGNACRWTGSYPGLQLFTYNRGERFGEMMDTITGKVTWQNFRDIKFDTHYSLKGTYQRNFKALYTLNAEKFPALKELINPLKSWDFNGAKNSTTASIAMVLHYKLMKKWDVPFAFLTIKKDPLTEADLVDQLKSTKKFMLKKYGSLTVELGTIQRHIRGNVNLPMGGLREVPKAIDAKLVDKKKGIWKVVNGDGYIQMNRYSKLGVEINSINAYGASAKPESTHYTDQMHLYANEQFKTMTFDWEQIIKKAERVYSPK